MSKKKKKKKETITIEKEFYDLILKTNTDLKKENVELKKEPKKDTKVVSPQTKQKGPILELDFRKTLDVGRVQVSPEEMKLLMKDVGDLLKKHKLIKLNVVAFYKWLP